MKFAQPLKTIDYGIAEADLVVFSSGGNQFPIEPIRVCRERGQRYVLIIHSVSETAWPRDDELEAMRYVYEGAEAAFFVSQANRQSTAFQLGFDSDKFRVAINPFNVAWETPLSWPDDRTRSNWAFVGRLEPGHKGVDLLLRAFARDRWRNRDLRINLYGTGPSEQSMKRMAAMLDLGERVAFHGQVTTIEKIWQENELLVLPSRHEGLPLVVVEAMLCGRPCVVTNVSGNPEHVRDGATGFLAGGPTVDEVDAALDRAWNDRSRLRAMGEAAYVAIRKQIPSDPARVFAQQLREIANRRS